MNFFKKGNQLTKEGRLDEAIAAYRSGIELNPNFFIYYDKLGEALSQQGKQEEAAGSFRRSCELNPNSALSHYNLGQVLTKLDRLDEAIAEYENALELKPNFYGFYKNLGDVLAKKGDLDRAITNYKRAIELNPKSSTAYLNLGKTLMLRVTQSPESFWNTYHSGEALPDIEKIDSQETHLGQLNDETFLQITKDIEDRDFVRKAYQTYLKRAADEQGEENHLSLLHRGIITREQLLKGFRQSREFKNLLIVSVCLQEAIALYRRSLELNPRCYESYYYLGEALVKQGDKTKAIACYQKASEIKPDFVEAHFKLLIFLKKREHIQLAVKNYQKALGLKANQNIKWKSVFKFKEKWLAYNRIPYNNSPSERTIEVPIAIEFLENLKERSKVLEVGNVLSYYQELLVNPNIAMIARKIIDKFEVAEDVENEDLMNIPYKIKYDAIVSVSTVEHIGQEREPSNLYGEEKKQKNRDIEAPLKAIAKIYDLLAEQGKALITVPFGVFSDFGWFIQFDRKYLELLTEKYRIMKTALNVVFLKLIDREENNFYPQVIWKEVDIEKMSDVKYGTPFPFANGVAVIELEKKDNPSSKVF